MKNIFILTVVFLAYSCINNTNKSLRISDNQRVIIENSGKPFLYLGDTAWELFHKLNREEAVEYLENRAEKGFTVIQAVVLAELDGLRTTNSYGELPLINLDPTKPNEKYFEHVDFIVNKATELGLYIGMLPTWGDKVIDEQGGKGPVVFNVKNAEVFGEFLGERYKNSNIIWILGGDRIIPNESYLKVWDSMASGLKKGDNGRHLITFHPRGGTSSSNWVHNQDWLDFNMYQSGHGERFNKVYLYANSSMLLNPSKPFVDGEPAYEDISIKFWEYLDWTTQLKAPKEVLDENFLIKDTAYFSHGFFTDYDVRIHAYWNFLSGACGYTYGNNAIWQMFKKKGEVAIPCLYDWQESLDRPGADDIRHVRALFESRPFSLLEPDQTIIFKGNDFNNKHIRAAKASDGSYLIAYVAMGQELSIQLNKIKAKTIVGWWYNPRNGKAIKIGVIDNTEKIIKSFTPPSAGMNNDWIIVLDAQSLNYPPPGSLN